MVFGRGNPVVDGLHKDERVLHSWKYKSKKSFMKSTKNIAVVTNKRLVFADRSSKKIFLEHNLSELSMHISNPSVKTSSNVNSGNSTSWSRGNVTFMYQGKDLANTETIDNPSDLLNEIESCRRHNLLSEEPPRMVLPKDEDDSNHEWILEGSQPTEEEEDPIKILKIRYAKGEITKEEFEDMKGMLE